MPVRSCVSENTLRAARNTPLVNRHQPSTTRTSLAVVHQIDRQACRRSAVEADALDASLHTARIVNLNVITGRTVTISDLVATARGTTRRRFRAPSGNRGWTGSARSCRGPRIPLPDALGGTALSRVKGVPALASGWFRHWHGDCEACQKRTVRRDAPEPSRRARERRQLVHIKDIMTRSVEVTYRDSTLLDAADRMRALNVGTLPVCTGDHVVGMITDRDITVRAIADGWDPWTTKVVEAMTPEVVFCFEDQNVSEAADLMKQKQVRRLVVFDRRHRLVGIVSLGGSRFRRWPDRRRTFGAYEFG